MTTITNEIISNTQLAPLLAGATSTAFGGSDLAKGNLLQGTLKSILGMALVNMGTLGHSEFFRNAVLQANTLALTATCAAEGVKNFCSGLYNARIKDIGKGLVQAAAGITGSYLVSNLASRVVATVSQTLLIANLSAIATYVGIQDIRKGNYVRGIAETVFGLGGIALSGLVAYNELNAHPFNHASLEHPPHKLATIYSNDKNHHRDEISKFVAENHERYAARWNLEHDVVDKDQVKEQCVNPFTGKPADCAPHFNKIQYFREQCSDPDQQGKWVIYLDDDALLNPKINPRTAIERLRAGKDTSVIMAYEGADWQPYYFPQGQTHDPRTGVNTGVIIARINPKTCEFMEKTWNQRNTVMNINNKLCPSLGFCANQDYLHEQQAMALVLKANPSLIDRDITLVLPRDKNRMDLAFNTFLRDGCQIRVQGSSWASSPHDIGSFDRQNYPDGIARKEDWIVQTAGFPVTGRYPLPRDARGQCVDDPSLPVRNIRLAKLHEFAPPSPDRHITFITTYLPDGNGPEFQYNDLTIPNHEAYARKHGAIFRVVTDNLLKHSCTHPKTGAVEDCGPYWNKVAVARQWLREPGSTGKEEWLVLADDDGVFANTRISPSQVIDDMRDSSNPSILIAKDICSSCSPINTGLVYIRKDREAQDFVEKWWMQRNVATSDPSHPTCPSHGLCKNQILSLNDQSGFDIALQKHPEVLNGVVKISEIRSSERPYGINSIFREGCFHRDQAHWKNDQVIEYSSDDSNDKGKQGDHYIQAAGVPRAGTYCDEPKSTKPHPIRRAYIERLLKVVT